MSTPKPPLSKPEITPGYIKRLKQSAKKLKKSSGINQATALNITAQEAGYPNWKAVLKAAGRAGEHIESPKDGSQDAP